MQRERLYMKRERYYSREDARWFTAGAILLLVIGLFCIFGSLTEAESYPSPGPSIRTIIGFVAGFGSIVTAALLWIGRWIYLMLYEMEVQRLGDPPDLVAEYNSRPLPPSPVERERIAANYRHPNPIVAAFEDFLGGIYRYIWELFVPTPLPPPQPPAASQPQRAEL